ncbi:MAG: ribonuclease D [Proteobacteria bacterium]|nr:ribonuclease D [Pseudomonadota bacterium]
MQYAKRRVAVTLSGMELEIIDNLDQLEAFCAHAVGQDWVCADTEFMREDTYYPKLCLIQIATQTRIVCIDTLIINDLSVLNQLFTSKTITKVFHAARQDLEILFMVNGEIPYPVFDTQIAASALGYGDQISYAQLVDELCGVQLDKSLSRTVWTTRPLPDKAIQYAANDVRYLSQAYTLLKKELDDKGRTHWVESECQNLNDMNKYKPDTHNLWKSVKGARKLSSKQSNVLRWLARWRDHEAMQQNRPRQWIMRDETLHELAVKQPTSTASLAQVELLTRKQRGRYAGKLLDCMDRAMQTRKEDWPEVIAKPALSRQQRKLLKQVKAFVRERADQLGITPNFLATRSMLETLVCEPEELSNLTSWRLDLIGNDLKQLLQEE